jgi:DNA-binding phage protein
MAARNIHIGSSFADSLREAGIYDKVMELAGRKRLVIRIIKEMEKQNVTKSEMAKRMKTSRSQLDRLLSLQSAVPYDTIEKMAHVLGFKLSAKLVPIAE